MTTARGTTAVFALSGEIAGIDYSVATTKKYAFESLENYNARQNGTKVSSVYFVVRM